MSIVRLSPSSLAAAARRRRTKFATPRRNRGGRITVALAILICAGVAHADELVAEEAASPAAPWHVHAFGGVRWFTDSSAVTLAEAPMGGGGWSVERRITTLGIPGPFDALDLSAEAGFDVGTASGTTFQQLESSMTTWQVSAGARARLPLVSWFHVTGRASVGGGRTEVWIRDMTTSTGIYDNGTTFGAQAALGVSLLPRLTSPGQRGVFLGLVLELGYQASTAISVQAIPEDRPAPELTIPAAYATLGDLDLEGWTLRIGTAIGF